MEEEVFTRDEAAAFLKVDRGTIAQWIKSGRLAATRKNPHKKKSPYLICKTDCIAAVKNPIHNQPVSAVDVPEDKACQSNNVPVRGTATSLRLVGAELDALLGQRTKGKRKSSMIS
ncbi:MULTISPECIES: helix-turn-helix domain-containing protein [Edwardsiella]|uniref:Helix-turn-helix domain-containing protein n=1 Tax=Edwardsiella anguillarum TaxID=1821960 RepID=A0ABY8SGF1_9GAMM|nr:MULTISPECIES: helix-turn-helix domain-containing protein [Edwardsiella]UBU94855.1 helix-turn-helix domain-containing protein [Edwardsiella sp. LADL05-105]WHP84610.1 helix-turn-helix domain-containing protein [Edwardsiella anguillarum]WHP88393.1 helix-turn-helix domain-containing protein [Edwardsiella anguillarum]WHP92193.1 helix-turn-helix domain-containing protein [Edwardsiella anguillarum]WHP95999.1 helix-turn-helix domain-containing protein [Edwardsiella anguillarum]